MKIVTYHLLLMLSFVDVFEISCFFVSDNFNQRISDFFRSVGRMATFLGSCHRSGFLKADFDSVMQLQIRYKWNWAHSKMTSHHIIIMPSLSPSVLPERGWGKGRPAGHTTWPPRSAGMTFDLLGWQRSKWVEKVASCCERPFPWTKDIGRQRQFRPWNK